MAGTSKGWEKGIYPLNPETSKDSAWLKPEQGQRCEGRRGLELQPREGGLLPWNRKHRRLYEGTCMMGPAF